MIQLLKRCLRKLVGQSKLTYEELLTELTEVEMILNNINDINDIKRHVSVLLLFMVMLVWLAVVD